MKISLIVATDLDGLIGRQQELPWHLPADLKYFKKSTLGKPIVMGRKTYESIGRPLPKRTNIVITRQRDFCAKGCVIVHDIESAIAAAANSGKEACQEIMVIGGANIYALFLDRADRLYRTEVQARVEGDTYFPAIVPSEWRELSREVHRADDANAFGYDFVILERLTR